MSIVGGYLEYCGGVQDHGGYHMEDIMMHVGDITSTMGVFSTVGDIMSTVGVYHDACGKIS